MPVFAQNCAHGRSNVGRGESGCRDLIEQGLKEMVICAVDHCDAHIFTTKLFGCLEPAKPRANDDGARLSCGRIFHTAKL